MSIYKSRYIGEEQKISSENHSSEEFNSCANEIINLLIRYKMNFEEACAVFDMIKERLDVGQVLVETILNYC